ncbi:MAG: rRNA pseudouridine synthase [Defluviitaleaceae bacterium]|nr:rRNA pseudouridine synthase [Defluviitaleaceae bacterium]
MEIRLQKWLSQSGVASRRKAEALILAGDVAVNGITITELGARANTSSDTVTVKGRACELISTKIYIALHKPEGVVTTVTDPFNRRTVMDCIPAGTPCFPIGRLDYDTSGLILLTNDGELAQRLTHPKHGVSKTYLATVKGTPSREALAKFRSGIMVDGQVTAPCEVEIIKKEHNAKLRIRLLEGRNRQVRKMCEAIGHNVISLKRVEVGPVKLGSLQRGEWRYLTAAEKRDCNV